MFHQSSNDVVADIPIPSIAANSNEVFSIMKINSSIELWQYFAMSLLAERPISGIEKRQTGFDENNTYKVIITEPFYSNGAMKFWK